MARGDRSSAVAIAFVVLLALGIRLAIVAATPFPLNDGGLFYTFINDLIRDGFALPVYSSYNGAPIPFAYPPLAFYGIAAVRVLAGAPVVQQLRFAPAILSILSIPAFFLLAREMLRSERQAVLATLVFSLLPRTFDWLIMGGGITRSLGLLFMLLTLRQVHGLFARQGARMVLGAAFFGSLVVVSHPQAVLHTVVSSLLFLLWYDRSARGVRNALLITGGVLVLTSPWWWTVLNRHGLDPFLAASAAARADSYNPIVGLVALLRFDFSDEPFLRLFAVLGLLGLALSIARREYLLAVWMLVMHTLDPRGGSLYMMIPLALASARFLDSLWLPALLAADALPEAEKSDADPAGAPWLVALLHERPAQLTLAFLVLYGSFAAFAMGDRIRQLYTLTPSDLRGLEWVELNTAPGSSFAVVTGGLPLRDAVSEWLPAVTGRRSAASVFGTEWVKALDFGDGLARHRSLQSCVTGGVRCLEQWRADAREAFDYVYLHLESGGGFSALHESLSHADGYDPVYTDGDLVIYRRR